MPLSSNFNVFNSDLSKIFAPASYNSLSLPHYITPNIATTGFQINGVDICSNFCPIDPSYSYSLSPNSVSKTNYKVSGIDISNSFV
jgi:hypothetical protein